MLRIGMCSVYTGKINLFPFTWTKYIRYDFVYLQDMIAHAILKLQTNIGYEI
jgi:hypothetical protein